MEARSSIILAQILTITAVIAACEGESPASHSDASLARVGPPSAVCSAPPEIHRIRSKPLTEPPPNEFNTGTFGLGGRNFQQGDVFVDGPLVVMGDPRINRPGTRIRKDWRIGCCEPEPGLFNVTVVTPCGSDNIEFPISGQDVVPLRLQPTDHCGDHPSTAIATFEDANLAARIMAALSVGAPDDLTCGLVSGLTTLDASGAGITSLVGIQNLTSLTDLNLDDNSITDLGPLIGLTSLTNLRLNDNASLTSLQPLIDNPGFGAGDRAWLLETSVSCIDVAALRAKGVTVFGACP